MEETNKKLFSIVKGQCTDVLIARIEAHDDYPQAKADRNGLLLLVIIKGITFNFDVTNGVVLSDIVVMPFFRDVLNGEILAADITENFIVGDVDIFNENENIFSCRNVIFACTDQDNPLLGALLEEAAGDDDDDDSASVASYEYGINNAIPHSRNAELLCPGNIINTGFVRINGVNAASGVLGFFGFYGLNNGNGRGSLDSFWNPNRLASFDPRG